MVNLKLTLRFSQIRKKKFYLKGVSQVSVQHSLSSRLHIATKDQLVYRSLFWLRKQSNYYYYLLLAMLYLVWYSVFGFLTYSGQTVHQMSRRSMVRESQHLLHSTHLWLFDLGYAWSSGDHSGCGTGGSIKWLSGCCAAETQGDLFGQGRGRSPG